MSLARIYTVKKSRKVWTCGKCHTELLVGSPVLSFAVGFRGQEQKRCTNPSCHPTLSERESSAVSSVYAAQEDVNLADCNSLEEIKDVVQQVIDACNEVADEYESSEMYDVNSDLQERADAVRSAGDELDSWDDGVDDEPTEDDSRDDDKEGDETEDFESAHEAWLEEARDAAQQAIDDMELP